MDRQRHEVPTTGRTIVDEYADRERAPIVDLLMLEYSHLKEEQRLRIATRDNLVYTTLAAQAVLAGAAIQSDSPTLMFAIAPVCVILGWTRMVNDQKVTAIRRYIHRWVRPELRSTLGRGSASVLGWEAAHRVGAGWRTRKIGQVLSDLLLCCAPAILAPLVVLIGGGPSHLTVAVAIVEWVAAASLGWQIVAASDMGIDG
jgi:hypothetical protein